MSSAYIVFMRRSHWAGHVFVLDAWRYSETLNDGSPAAGWLGGTCGLLPDSGSDLRDDPDFLSLTTSSTLAPSRSLVFSFSIKGNYLFVCARDVLRKLVPLCSRHLYDQHTSVHYV